MARLEVIRNAGEIRSLPELLDRIRRARGESPTGAIWLRGISNECHRLIPSPSFRVIGSTDTPCPSKCGTDSRIAAPAGEARA